MGGGGGGSNGGSRGLDIVGRLSNSEQWGGWGGGLSSSEQWGQGGGGDLAIVNSGDGLSNRKGGGGSTGPYLDKLVDVKLGLKLANCFVQCSLGPMTAYSCPFWLK